MSDRVTRLRIMRVIARMNVGGPARQVTALMRGLDPDRFDHRLYVGSAGADEVDFLDLCAPDIPVYRLPTLGRRVRAIDDLRALAGLVRAMREFRPHLVHTHTAKAGALGRVAATLAGVPTRVHTFHGHLLHGYFTPAVRRMVVGVERALARPGDRLIAVGEQVGADLLAAGIGRPDQYHVVPPGTSLPTLPDRQTARQRLGLAADGPVVAYVGRVTTIKRPDRLLAVAQRVWTARPDATVLVCGSGDQAGALVDAARPDAPLRMLGWRLDVENVYAAADLTLLTSDNEGMPVSLIESGLAGVPAVATDVGSVREVVRHGVTGTLVQPRADADAVADELAAAVLRLLDDDELRRRMGHQARIATERRFGAARLVADIEKIYSAIAVQKGWWPSARLGKDAHR